jgi:hypothetical protein
MKMIMFVLLVCLVGCKSYREAQAERKEKKAVTYLLAHDKWPKSARRVFPSRDSVGQARHAVIAI